jgi:hypothetical protein
MRKHPSLGIWLASLVWICVVALGFAPLFSYAARPGPSGQAAVNLPAEAGGRARLIMTLHPRCPCSHASLSELDRLVAHLSRPTGIRLIFVGAEGNDSSLLEQAQAIQGAVVEHDPSGAQAKLLGAQTSGDTFYYDTSGALRFHGGLTSSRGHEGQSPGQDAILALDAERETSTNQAPAFGCLLDAPQ